MAVRMAVIDGYAVAAGIVVVLAAVAVEGVVLAVVVS